MADNNLPPFPSVPQIMQGSKPPSRKGIALAAVLGISISGAVATMNDTQANESGGRLHLEAYLDSVKIATICDGIIRYPDGRPVRLGDKATPEQCDAYYEFEIVNHARPLIRGVPQLYGRENQARALVDVTYNCGVPFVVNGAIGANIRAGNWQAAKAHVLDCRRGTFRTVPPSRVAFDCVKKAKGGFACTIPGLLARRQRNQARFAIDLPAQGAR